MRTPRPASLRPILIAIPLAIPLAIALAIALIGMTSCESGTQPAGARAYQATSRTQLVGGSAAVGDVGDWVIENDQVKFVVLGGHSSPGPALYGGSLADADLQRAEPEFRGGQGLDSLSEVFPMANLATPAPEATDVVVENDGQDGRAAVLKVSAPTANYLKALDALKLVGVPMEATMTTRYSLPRGSRVLDIETVITFSDGVRDTVPMAPLLEAPDIFGTLLAPSLKKEGPLANTGPGAVAGDFLFYGNKTDIFAPGYGFDLDHKLREVFNGGCDTVNTPVGVESLAAEGDRVSYAYAGADGAGRTWVPLFASSFTAVITHDYKCPSSLPCLGAARLKYARHFAVGDGDAASAQGALWARKGVETGRLSGHLRDERSGLPVSGARVLVLRDPGAAAVSDEALETDDVDALLGRIYDANRKASTRTCADCEACSSQNDPHGEPGIVTSMRTDRGTDRVLDGDFSASLPPGRYLLVARSRTRPTSRPLRVEVTKGDATTAELSVASPATLEVHITDEAGRPMPGKVTLGRCLPECRFDFDCGDGRYCDAEARLCFPKGGCDEGGCAPYESCPEGKCQCRAATDLDVALGDPLLPDHIALTAFAGADGIARLEVRPGAWEYVASRGFEYDLARGSVTLDPRRPARRDVTVPRVVDTRGWISADFHVHGIRSHDAFVGHEARVQSMMAEGVELLSSSDHDALTDFGPAVRALGAQPFLKTQVGLESTTVEMGHFIGAPLRYDELAEGPGLLRRAAGAFDWLGLPPGEGDFCDADGDGYLNPAFERVVPKGDPEGVCRGDPLGRDPGIIGRLRSMAAEGSRTVVTVPHPRDGFFGYFDQFGLSPFDLSTSSQALELLAGNTLVRPELFSTAFDAIELFNGKRLDAVRTATVREVEGFKQDLTRCDRARGVESYEACRSGLADKWIRRVLERTPEEAAAYAASDGSGTCDGEGCIGEQCPPSPCIGHRGVVDDWFRLLNAGVRVTGVGNSDTHTLLSNESGLPRNYVRSRTDEPVAIRPDEIADSLLGQEAVASYGPFVTLDIDGVGIGGTRGPVTGPVRVHVSVESPLWFDVDRLELYRNGVLWKAVRAGEGATQPDCARVDTVPNRAVLNFDCTFTDSPQVDSWYAAIALGLSGKDLRPVYTSVPVPNLEISELTERAFGGLKNLPIAVPVKPEVSRQVPMLPLAVTNPVWVDLDGRGFAPPLAAAPGSPYGTGVTSQPLSAAAVTRPPVSSNDDLDDGPRTMQLVRRRLVRAFESLHHRPAGQEER